MGATFAYCLFLVVGLQVACLLAIVGLGIHGVWHERRAALRARRDEPRARLVR